MNKVTASAVRAVARIPLWILVVAILTVVGVWSAWSAYEDYRSVIRQEYRLLEVRARQRDARISGALRSVNLMLGSISSDLLEHPVWSVADKNQLLGNYLRQLPELRNLIIVDASGHIQAEAKGISVGQDASAREYFQHHAADPGNDKLFMSRPFTTYSGLVGTPVSRVLRNRKGQFAGIVIASIDSSFFEESLKLSTPEPGVEAVLINFQGDILSRVPINENIGKNLQGGTAFTEHTLSGRQTTQHLNVVKFDTVKKMSVFHNLPELPLTVIVSRKYDVVMAEWSGSLLSHTVRFLVLAAAILFFSWLATRRQQALARAQQELSSRALELHTVIETEPDGVMQIGPDGTLLEINSAGLAILEADSREQVLGTKVQQWVQASDLEAFLSLMRRGFQGDSDQLAFAVHGLKGGYCWLEMHAAPLRAFEQEITALLAITRDITARIRAETELRNFKAIVDFTDDAVISTSLDGVIKTWNGGAERMFGYSAEEALGQSMQFLIPANRKREAADMLSRIGNNERVDHYDSVRLHKSGRQIDISATLSPILDAHGQVVGASKIAKDVTERKAAENRIGFMASHDPLTALPNRDLFYDRLSQTISFARRKRQQLAILFLDLDGFKIVNDTYGHELGDATLKEVAKRLLACVREIDTVARLGGDEFAIVLNEIRAEPDAAVVAEKIIRKVSAPMSALDGRAYGVGVSIGIAMYPECGTEIDNLMKASDQAMYQSKMGGKNRFTFGKPLDAPLSAGDSWVHFGASHLVGVPSIDAQHQKIADMLNVLNVALTNFAPHDNTVEQLEAIVDYVVFHFETEDSLMTEYDYPGAQEHVEEHQRLVNEVKYLKLRFSQGGELRVLQWLKDWFLGHIEGSDKPLGRHLNRQGMQ